ncbi:MAG: hypothetical protein KDA42_06050 [Planctomycetales bacterium]|nr:hypothetical protein [Planctomycetales bacterium]
MGRGSHFLKFGKPGRLVRSLRGWRRVGLERLEGRELLAGDCTAAVTPPGRLTITCDGADNELTLTESGGVFTLTGAAGTKVNSQSTPQNFSGVTDDVVIDLRNGDDVLLVDGVDVGGDLRIDGGRDANRIEVRDSTIAKLLRAGAQDATISGAGDVFGQFIKIENTDVGGDVRIRTHDSEASSTGGNSTGNYVVLAGNQVGGSLFIMHGDAISTSDAGTSIGNDTLIHGGNSIGGKIHLHGGEAWATGNGDFVESTGNRNLIEGNTLIGGKIRIDNGKAVSIGTGHEANANGSVTSIVGNTSIDGEITIQNAEARGTVEGSEAAATGNFVLVYDNDAINGDIDVFNEDGRGVAVGDQTRADGNYTDIHENGVIQGDVRIQDQTGRASARGLASEANGNASFVDLNTSIDGDIEIWHHQSEGRTTMDDSLSRGSWTLVELNGSLTGDVEIHILDAFGRTTGDNSESFGAHTQVFDQAIGGRLNLRINKAESVATGVGGTSQDSLTAVSGTTVAGDLKIKANRGDDEILLDMVDVTGKTDIATGQDDDYLTVLDSVFADPVEVNGGQGDDTFEDSGGNTFPAGSPELEKVENII